MFQSDFRVSLNTKKSCSQELIDDAFYKATEYIKNSDLTNTFRIYLTVMASLAYKLSGDLEAVSQNVNLILCFIKIR